MDKFYISSIINEHDTISSLVLDDKSNGIFKRINNSENKNAIFVSEWIEPKYFSLYSYNNSEKLTTDNFFIIKNNNLTFTYLKKFLETFSTLKGLTNHMVFPSNKLFGECIKVKINYDKINYFTQFNDNLIKLDIKEQSDIRKTIMGKKIKIEFNISISGDTSKNTIPTNYMILNINKIICEYEKKLEPVIKKTNSRKSTKSENSEKNIDKNSLSKKNSNITTRFYDKKYSKKSLDVSNKEIINILLNN